MTIPSLFDLYPYGPATGRRDTSKAAARAIGPKDKPLRERLLRWFEQYPDGGTADEACMMENVSPFQGRPRVCQLVKLGVLEDTGRRRKNAQGNSCIVWRKVVT